MNSSTPHSRHVSTMRIEGDRELIILIDSMRARSTLGRGDTRITRIVIAIGCRVASDTES